MPAILRRTPVVKPANLRPLDAPTLAGADFEDCPEQPTAGDPEAPRLELLRCLASPAPLQHPAFSQLKDGTELVAESFCLCFAECAARGELSEWQRGGWRQGSAEPQQCI